MNELPNNKMSLVFKQNITVYPVHNDRGKMAVQVEDKNHSVFLNTITTGEFKHSSITINKAITDTINHIYKQLTNN